MKSQLISDWGWRIALFVFGGLALISVAAALFFLVSDDFVIRGQVVPARDSRIVGWRVGSVLGAAFSVVLAWLCHRRSCRVLNV